MKKDSVDTIKKDIERKYNTKSPLEKYNEDSVFTDLTSIGADNRVSLKKRNIDISQAYDTLSDGSIYPRFEKFYPNIDNEEYLAQTQTTSEKWLNGISKFSLKVNNVVLGATVGSVYSLGAAITEGSFDALYDNSFTNWSADLDKKLNYDLPNYYSKQEKDLSLFESLGTANFWADKALGGLSYLTGTIISEAIWAVATGGTSLLARGLGRAARGLGRAARWSSKALGRGKALKATNKFKELGSELFNKGAKESFEKGAKSAITGKRMTEAFNKGRFIYTSAGYESSVMVLQYKKEATENFITEYENSYGERPSMSTISEYESNLEDSANALYAANVALVGGTNLAAFGKLLYGGGATKKASNSFVKKNLFGIGYEKAKDGTVSIAKASKLQKSLAKSYDIAKPIFAEGFEEGGQSVMSESMMKYNISGYDPELTKGNVSMMEALYDGFKESFGTKEGGEQVLIGSLIGLLGGGFQTGFKFNDSQRQRQSLEQMAKNYNNFKDEDLKNSFVNKEFTAKNLSTEIVAANKARQADKNANEAVEEQDVVKYDMANKESVLAKVERDYDFEGIEKGYKDFETYMYAEADNIQEELELNKEQTQDFIKEKLNEYKEISKEYKNNRDFAESVIAKNNFQEFKNAGIQRDVITKAIASNLTLGKDADNIARSKIKEIQDLASNSLTDEDIKTLGLQDRLRKISKEKEKDFKKAQREYNKVKKQYDKVQDRLAKINNSKEIKEQEAKERAELVTEFETLQKQLQQADNNKESAFRALNLNRIDQEIVTKEDLENQDKNLQNLRKSLKNLDNVTKNKVDEATAEYKRAVKYATNYSKLANDLLDGKQRLTEITSMLSKLVGKNRQLTEEQSDFFLSIIKDYTATNISTKATQEQEQATDQTQTENKDKPVKNNKDEKRKKEEESVLEGVRDDRTQDGQGQESTELRTEEEKEVETEEDSTTKLQKIKDKIKNLLYNNEYTKRFTSADSVEELAEDLPEKEEIERFTELFNKLSNKEVNNFNNDSNYQRLDSLNKEEKEEFKNLNRKLGNWAVYDGISQDNASVYDLLSLLLQYNNAKQDNVKTSLNQTDYKDVKEASEEDSEEKYVSNTVQTPDNVKVKILKDKIQISHLNLNSLQDLIPNVRIVEIKKDGTRTAIKENQKPSKKKEYVIEFGDKSIPIKVIYSGRLSVDKKSFLELIKQNEQLKIVNYGVSSYLDLYKKDQEGNYVPIKGDFNFSDEQVMEEMIMARKPGEEVSTKVDLNNPYNKKLIDNYNKAENKEDAKKELLDNLLIFVTNKDGQILGSLKKMQEFFNKEDQQTQALSAIRKLYTEKAISSENSEVEVPFRIKIKNILLGSPNFTVRTTEEGLEPISKEISDKDNRAVVTTGFAENGELTLADENIEVNETYTKKIEEKTPVVVFKYKNTNIAFPVSIIKPIENRTQELESILSTSISNAAKISKINNLLISLGMNPKNYILDPSLSLQSETNMEVLNNLYDRLENFESNKNLNDWGTKNLDLDTVKDRALISLKMSGKPLNSAKIVLDLSDFRIIDNKEMYGEILNGVENTFISLENRISEDAIKYSEEILNSERTQDYAEMQSNFISELTDKDETIIENPKNHLDKLRNVKVLRNSLGLNIKGEKVSNIKPPKKFLDNIGRENWEKTKKNMSRLFELRERMNNIKTNIKQELKQEAENQKADCNTAG